MTVTSFQEIEVGMYFLWDNGIFCKVVKEKEEKARVLCSETVRETGPGPDDIIQAFNKRDMKEMMNSLYPEEYKEFMIHMLYKAWYNKLGWFKKMLAELGFLKWEG